MNKLVVGFIVVIVALSPYIFGIYAKDIIHQYYHRALYNNITNLEESYPQLRDYYDSDFELKNIVVIDYKQGYLSSSFKIKINYEEFLAQDKIQQLIKSDKSLSPVISKLRNILSDFSSTNDVKHGPIISTSSGLNFGLAHLTSKVYYRNSPFHTTLADISNNTILMTHKTEKIKFYDTLLYKGDYGTSKYVITDDSSISNFVSAGLEVDSQFGKLNIDDVKADLTMSKGLVNTLTTTVKSMAGNLLDQASFNLSDYKYILSNNLNYRNTNAAISQNINSLNIIYREANAQKKLVKLKNIASKVTISNLNYNILQELIKKLTVYEQELGKTKASATQKLIEKYVEKELVQNKKIIALLKNHPKFNLDFSLYLDSYHSEVPKGNYLFKLEAGFNPITYEAHLGKLKLIDILGLQHFMKLKLAVDIAANNVKFSPGPSSVAIATGVNDFESDTFASIPADKIVMLKGYLNGEAAIENRLFNYILVELTKEQDFGITYTEAQRLIEEYSKYGYIKKTKNETIIKFSYENMEPKINNLDIDYAMQVYQQLLVEKQLEQQKQNQPPAITNDPLPRDNYGQPPSNNVVE